jgi:arsenate reductase-like glutaredoxin family protein
VIVDIDGTLANHEGVRGPFQWHKVHLDRPYEVIVKWVRNLSPEYRVFIVSGRDGSSRKSTEEWLRKHDIEYEKLYMRRARDFRKDTIVKKEILDQILRTVPKESIAFVIDDRPSVVEMWRENGLRVFPARGAIDPF